MQNMVKVGVGAGLGYSWVQRAFPSLTSEHARTANADSTAPKEGTDRLTAKTAAVDAGESKTEIPMTENRSHVGSGSISRWP